MPNNGNSLFVPWLQAILIGIVMVILTAVSDDWIGADGSGNLPFADLENGKLPDAFWPRIQLMLVMAILIERATAVILGAAGFREEKRYLPDLHIRLKSRDLTRAAAVAGLLLGVLAAMVGVRILDPFLTPDFDWTGKGSMKFTLHFANVALSAGLLAGGAKAFYPLMSIMTNGLTMINQQMTGQNRGAGLAPGVVMNSPDARLLGLSGEHLATQSFSALKSYEIRVVRGSGNSGTLTFQSGGVSVSSDCWWDENFRIDAGVHSRCSKTMMATKQRPGIHMPGAKVGGQPNNNIFIHKGTGANWSDGCIVLSESEMNSIWNTIEPSDGFNVTVTVVDKP